MLSRGIAVLSVVLMLAGFLAGCGSPAEPAIPENAALKITGSVDKEIGWTEEDVRAMQTTDAVSTNSKGESETYTGVALNTLLELAGPASDATAVTLVADDGSTAEMALADLQSCADCIASFRNQGGFSVVAPGFAKGVQLKGLVEIQVQ